LRQLIPNTITSANLFCGCLAIVNIAEANLMMASIFVLLGAFFDFFDGMAARLLNAGSSIGAQLDSLADMVTFGVAPAFLTYQWLGQLQDSPLNYAAFLIAVFSAVRLAKFNVDERQTSSFIGVPTPANAMLWVALPLIQWQNSKGFAFFELPFLEDALNNYWLILSLVFIFSYLLVAELPLLSLKFSSFKWQGNQPRFSLLLSAAVLIGLFCFAAIPFILILYLILSIIQTYYKRSNEIQS
jgi:CDP-diacylglycerol--serine O-phosphatidyltransferase